MKTHKKTQYPDGSFVVDVANKDAIVMPDSNQTYYAFKGPDTKVLHHEISSKSSPYNSWNSHTIMIDYYWKNVSLKIPRTSITNQ